MSDLETLYLAALTFLSKAHEAVILADGLDPVAQAHLRTALAAATQAEAAAELACLRQAWALAHTGDPL